MRMGECKCFGFEYEHASMTPGIIAPIDDVVVSLPFSLFSCCY
jgi:hypothetical protein